MQFVVHMPYLRAEPAAVVVLNAALKLVVQLTSFSAKVFVLVLDPAASAVGAHLAPDMIHHPVKMIDVALQSAQTILPPALSSLKYLVIVGARSLFVNAAIISRFAALLIRGLLKALLLDPALLIEARLNLLVFFVRKCGESETREAQKRDRGDSDWFVHMIPSRFNFRRERQRGIQAGLSFQTAG